MSVIVRDTGHAHPCSSIGAMSPVAQPLGDTTASSPRDHGQSSNARTHQPRYEGGATGQVDVSDGRLVSETIYPFTTPLPQRAFSSPYQVTDANDRRTSSVRPSFHEAEQQHVSPRFDSNRHEHNPYGASSTPIQVKQYSAASHMQTGNFSGIAGSSMSLEDHIDRESAIYIISLYFEYVSAPSLHIRLLQLIITGTRSDTMCPSSYLSRATSTPRRPRRPTFLCSAFKHPSCDNCSRKTR